MCGITGIVYFNKERKIAPEVLKSMADVIHHRGPDDEGYHIQKNVGLAFRRLSIIDLNTGHQPLSNHDDSIHIIFNGEIYNYQEHRDALKRKGYIFKTTTDTEVILHLYEEYGTKCLQYLRGMFAFALWDSNKEQLFCARDRFGIKPFYYYADGEKFVFGSEIKSILKEGGIDTALSYEALNSFFAFGYITSDKAIYEKIKKLQPAHYLLVSLKNKADIHIEKYWHIEFTPDYSKSEKQWIEEIDATLSETVRLHMISDVPLGAFLSGGIDSSSVVAAMAKNSDRPIETFSMGFKQEKYSELKHARQIAKKFHCKHHEEIVDPESICLLPKLVRAYDEPFADPSVIPTYYVSKFAREHVTVALSGDGGDELFAGYNIYPYLQRIYKYNLTPSLVNKAVWGNVNKLIPQAIRGKTLTYFLSQNRNYLGAHLCIWPKDERKKLIRSNGTLRYTNAPEIFKERLLSKRSKNDFLSNHLHLDMETYMVDDILTKVDRASMMNSLEVRVPLLDHKFAELTFRIPSNLKLKGTEQKYIFKQAIKNALPEIVNRPKTGFGVPLSLWFKEGLKEYVNDTLFVTKPLLSDHLDWNYIKSMTKNDKDGMEKFSARIWSLLWFEEWLKQRKEA
jgi:asparagine synthase (glutamine-hydrolysing)